LSQGVDLQGKWKLVSTDTRENAFYEKNFQLEWNYTKNRWLDTKHYTNLKMRQLKAKIPYNIISPQ